MIRRLSKKSHLSEAAVARLLDTIAHEAAEALARGESFTIPGVCTLTTRELGATTTTNLCSSKDGSAHTTPPRRKVRCKPAKELLALANAQVPQGQLPIVG